MKNPLSHAQMRLFARPSEKGGREWNAFNTIRADRAGMFRVATPRKHEIPRYPNIVPIRRYPRRIFPRFAP